MTRPLALFSVSVAAACLLSLYLFSSLLPALVWGGLFLLVFLLARRRWESLGPLALGLAFGFFWFALYGALFYAPAQDLEDRTIRLEAVVTGWPSPREHGITVACRGGEGDGRKVSMLLYLDADYAKLKPGDNLSAVAYCSSSQWEGEGKYIYRAKGIYLFARTYGPVTVTEASGASLRHLPVYMAKSLRELTGRLYDAQYAPFVSALLTGYTKELSEGDQAALSRSGLSHVVSVSGLHIAFLAGAMNFLLGSRKKSAVLVQIVVICFFAAMAGNAPGAWRAAILCSAGLVAPLVDRESDALTSLSTALFLLLLANPYAIASAGLQFSFGATLGIYLLGLPLYIYWRGKIPKKFRKAAAPLVSLFAVTLGALAFTLPLTALYFDQISLVAPLSNLLTGWAVSLSFFGGLLSLLLGALWLPLGSIVAALTTLPLGFFLGCARVLGSLPFAALHLQSVYFQAFLVFLYGILALVFLWWRKGVRRAVLPASACLCALCLSMLLTGLSTARAPLRFTLLDVGQGQCIALTSGSYRALIDCGGTKNPGEAAADYLHSQGFGSLDLLILTHYHADHSNGLEVLFSQVQVKTLVVPDTEPDSPLRLEIEAMAAAQGTEIYYATRETLFTFGSAALTVYPPLETGGEGENEAGLTILCSLHDWEALVTGDMNSETEAALLARYPLPDIELLVLGHHGSRYSTSDALLEAVKPDMALVSVGYNTYGHPAQDTLTRLQNAEIPLYRTDTLGRITVLPGE